MKKFLNFFCIFAVAALLSSCDKDPIDKPDPDPPPTEVTVVIELDFSAKPEDMTLDFGSSGIILLNADKKAFMKAPPTLPITTIRLTGQEAAKVAGKKIYIYIDGGRYYITQNARSWIIIKAINPVLVMPGVNKLVIPVQADLSIPCEEIDP